MVTARESERLEKVVKKVGQAYGFADASAEYCEFPELKVRWVRTIDSIQFTLSDYVAGANAKVLASLFETVFKRFTEDADAPYSQDFIEFVTSPEFKERNQKKYIKRNNYTLMTCAEEIIKASVDRLDAAGLIPERAEGTLIRVAPNCDGKPSKTSVLMGVVALNPRTLGMIDKEFDAVLLAGLCASAWRFGEKVDDMNAIIVNWLDRVGMLDDYRKAEEFLS